MLQLKEIGRLLSTVVTGESGILAASLLSSRGLPLINVSSPDAAAELSSDNLKIYSLLAINSFKQQAKADDPELDSWVALDLESDHRAIVKQFLTVMNDKDESLNDMYVVVFYSSALADVQAKVRVDRVTAALAAGLQGYKSH